MVDLQRRTLLQTLGITTALGLSGCTQLLDEETQNTPEQPETPESTETPTETATATPEPDIPESYRADRKRIASEGAEPRNIGNYNTERNWDNLTTNTTKINQMQNEWLNQEAYNPLIDQIMQGEDLSPGNKIFPNWEGEDDGYFDQDTVKNEEDFETLIRWYLPLIRHHDRENYGNAPSSRSHRFGATMEKLINEHHPNAEAQATDVNSLPGHGIFGVQDQNNEEFYLVDTTPSSAQAENAVGKIGDFITSEGRNRSELWDPFHEFQPGEGDIIYSSKSRSGLEALIGFVGTNKTGENFDQFFATDEWMNDAYNLLRNGGSIDSITEPLEEITYKAAQREDNSNIGIYGTLDDTRIAVDSGNEIYEKVMEQPEPQSIEDIETMLEAA